MNTIKIKNVDQYKSTADEFTNDLAFRLLFDQFTNVYEETGELVGASHGDIEAIVMARCMTTGENENELLQMIDNKLNPFGFGI